MTFFVDANVIVYAAVQSPYRDPCLGILETIARGEADGRTSTAALEEVWWIELSGKAGNLTGLASRAYAVLTPLLAVTDEAFREALALSAPDLGPNDRLHVGTCHTNEIEIIVSADRGFDAVQGLRRVDPLDANALRQLLR